jgi:hypothetical protein
MFSTPKSFRFVVAAAALLSVAVTSAQAPDWSTVRSKEGGFSLTMPGSPKMETVPFKSQGHTGVAYRWATTEGRNTFVMCYAPIPAEFQSQLKQDLDRDPLQPDVKTFLELAAKQVAGRLGKQTDGEAMGMFRGLPCLTTITNVSGAMVRTTTMLSYQRVYFMLTLTPKGEEDGADVRKFLGSFKVPKI